MTTKTSISLSPFKRSPNSKKRRLSLTYRTRQQTKMLTINYEKQIQLPDLLQDILIEQQRKEMLVHIAHTLRKVGDDIDEQLQINNNTSSSISIDHIFGQRTITFTHCLSRVLAFFL